MKNTVLDHDDLIVLARLLGNHHVSQIEKKEPPLSRQLVQIGRRLLEYAERTGEYEYVERPVKMRVPPPEHCRYGSRAVFEVLE